MLSVVKMAPTQGMGGGTNENSASVPLHRELVNLERGNKTIGGCPNVERVI